MSKKILPCLWGAHKLVVEMTLEETINWVKCNGIDGDFVISFNRVSCDLLKELTPHGLSGYYTAAKVKIRI